VRRIVAADIGGTHARFALATIKAGQPVELDEPVKFQASDYASFQTAFEEFGRRMGGNLPGDLAIALAGPATGESLRLTNNPWVLSRSSIKERLGIERLTVVNDFAAVGHAVACLPQEYFRTICGRDKPLPGRGVISIVGPGTGLGVAMLLRTTVGYEVVESEGGHVDFAPLDTIEDRILVQLRRNFRRVSVERIASGRGLWNLYEALASIEERPLTLHDDKELWASALESKDSLASAALDRFCLTLGSVAGDIALTQGAAALVIAGGVGLRLGGYLPRSGFRDRFIAKGRFERRMNDTPVKLITYPEPGLFGAATAFAREYPE
jgi:glucokinase